MRLHLLLILLLAPLCGAQTILVAAGSIESAGADPQDHGWVCVPTRDVTLLLHVPPGTGRGNAGALGLATKLNEQPATLAAHGREVFLCFEPERSDDQGVRRRVLALSARPAASGSQWDYTGSERLRVLPSIEGDVELFGFEATSSGVYALVATPDGRSFLKLDNNRWEQLSLPPQLGESLRLIRFDDDLMLIDRSSPVRLWTFADGVWTRADRSFESSAQDVPASLPLVGVAGRLVWLEHAQGGLSLKVAGPGLRFDFGDVASTNEDVAFFNNGATPSVVVFKRDRDDQQSLGSLSMRRISVATGDTINEASVSITGPVTASQFVLVLVMLAGILMMILTFVFWPEQRVNLRLPDELMIATSSRRLVAGSIDLILGVIPAALIVGAPVSDVLLPGLSENPLDSLTAGILGVGIACAQSIITEATMHRSLGKALMGLEVFGVSGGTIRPLKPREAFLRNIVRWWLAPAALAGLCRTWRHLGDLAANSVVTQQKPEEVDEEE